MIFCFLLATDDGNTDLDIRQEIRRIGRIVIDRIDKEKS